MQCVRILVKFAFCSPVQRLLMLWATVTAGKGHPNFWLSVLVIAPPFVGIPLFLFLFFSPQLRGLLHIVPLRYITFGTQAHAAVQVVRNYVLLYFIRAPFRLFAVSPRRRHKLKQGFASIPNQYTYISYLYFARLRAIRCYPGRGRTTCN